MHLRHHMHGGVWYEMDDADVKRMEQPPSYMISKVVGPADSSNPLQKEDAFMKGNPGIGFVQLVKTSTLPAMISDQLRITGIVCVHCHLLC